MTDRQFLVGAKHIACPAAILDDVIIYLKKTNV